MKRAICAIGASRKSNGIVLALTVTLGLFLFFAGCKSPQQGPPREEFPAFESLASAHNQRLALLQTIYANGVIEIRWRDRKGRHYEQGNIEMWLHQPSLTALRVEKLGEVLMWLGSDEQRYWFFDLVSEDRLLRTGHHDQMAPIGDEGAFGVKPLTLLDLMGMTPLLPSTDEPPEIEYSTEQRAWTLLADGRGGTIRMYFDRQSLLPIRVEALAEDGSVVVYSLLRRYESVRQRDMAVASYPKMPHLIDVISAVAPAQQDAGITQGEVKIAINAASGDVDQGQLDRVFDLQRLMQALRPATVQEQ